MRSSRCYAALKAGSGLMVPTAARVTPGSGSGALGSAAVVLVRAAESALERVEAVRKNRWLGKTITFFLYIDRHAFDRYLT